MSKFSIRDRGKMTAEDVKQLLHLQPHPREGGWFIRTYESLDILTSPGKRYPGPRRGATAIYYLLEADTFSEMHRLQSDEIFHFYAGDAVEMLHLYPNGEGRVVVLESNLAAGQRPQVLVERGVWQGARMVEGGSWTLLGCTVAPGFEYEDYESTGCKALSAGWPQFEEKIRLLTRSI